MWAPDKYLIIEMLDKIPRLRDLEDRCWVSLLLHPKLWGLNQRFRWPADDCRQTMTRCILPVRVLVMKRWTFRKDGGKMWTDTATFKPLMYEFTALTCRFFRPTVWQICRRMRSQFSSCPERISRRLSAVGGRSSSSLASYRSPEATNTWWSHPIPISSSQHSNPEHVNLYFNQSLSSIGTIEKMEKVEPWPLRIVAMLSLVMLYLLEDTTELIKLQSRYNGSFNTNSSMVS